eukprot:scaffold289748_cov17-Tisochrysis_lutea.AAC.1
MVEGSLGLWNWWKPWPLVTSTTLACGCGGSLGLWNGWKPWHLVVANPLACGIGENLGLWYQGMPWRVVASKALASGRGEAWPTQLSKRPGGQVNQFILGSLLLKDSQ